MMQGDGLINAIAMHSRTTALLGRQSDSRRRQDGGWAGRRRWQDDGIAGQWHSRATTSQDMAKQRRTRMAPQGRRRATQGNRRTMAAASQVKTAALEGGGVLGQTLNFPIALIPC